MEKFWEYLEDEDRLVKPTTLILGIVAISIIIFAADGVIKDLITSGTKRRLFTYIALLATWVIVWTYLKYSLPKNRKNKIGIVLCITTESDKEKIRLKKDFLNSLNNLLSENQLHRSVNIILLKNHQAERLIPVFTEYARNFKDIRAEETATGEIPKGRKVFLQKIQKPINGHLYIFGTIARRNHPKFEETYVWETNILLTHRRIDPVKREKLEKYMRNAWITNMYIPEKMELIGFRLYANVMFLIAKYIIGVAAYLVGDPLTAIKLHENLDHELNQLNSPHPKLIEIKQQMSILLSSEYGLLGTHKYLSGDFQDAKENLDKSLQINPEDYSTYIAKAIVEFDVERNPEKSLETITQAKKYAGRNGTWRYSEAFLLLYLERFALGLGSYRQIARYSFEGEDDTLEQVYQFNQSILESEPNKIQSHFILVDHHDDRDG